MNQNYGIGINYERFQKILLVILLLISFSSYATGVNGMGVNVGEK